MASVVAPILVAATPVLLALSAAASWGTADFFGGLASRRGGRVNAVALGSQVAGLVTFVPIVFIVDGRLTLADFVWSFSGGTASGFAIYLLYTGFTRSRTGVVAPIAAIGTAAIPAVFGLAAGESISWTQAIGIPLALFAIWLITRQSDVTHEPHSDTAAGVFFGIAASLGFATMFICLDQLTADSGAWGVLPLRLGGAVLLMLMSAARGLPMMPIRGVRWVVVASGLIGSLGNLAFIVATRLGNLSVVSVVSSLFPAATVGLAYLFLHERLSRIQLGGVITALVAVALVSAG